MKSNERVGVWTHVILTLTIVVWVPKRISFAECGIYYILLTFKNVHHQLTINKLIIVTYITITI